MSADDKTENAEAPEPRGFGRLSKERRQQIASAGGKARRNPYTFSAEDRARAADAIRARHAAKREGGA